MAEGFGKFPGVVDGKEEEPSVGGETPFQDEGVPVGVGSEKITEGLKSHDYEVVRREDPAAGGRTGRGENAAGGLRLVGRAGATLSPRQR